MRKTRSFFWLSVFCILVYFVTNKTSLIPKWRSKTDEHGFNKSVRLLNRLGTHRSMPRRFTGRKLPFHQVFEPRKIGFPDDLKLQKIARKDKLILLWTKWNGVYKTINYYALQPGVVSFVRHNCPNPNCRATYDRNLLREVDAVLFHLIDTNSADLPTFRVPHQVWILYNMEAPWLVQTHLRDKFYELKHLFNWTMSYRSNSNVVAKYGFITRSQETDVKDSTEESVERKNNVVWFVSDCSTDSRREDYVEELKKYIDIDIYGKCGDHECFPSQSANCYNQVLRQYKFYLSFENAICPDYVTEKFFNIFNHNIIPVVLGGANYSQLAPEGTFINAINYPQPKSLAEFLFKISNDENILKSMLKRKRNFTSYLDPWMCRLCNYLHSPSKQSILDFDSWSLDHDQCLRWNKLSQTFESNKNKDWMR